MKRSQFQITLSLLAVFLSGAIVGGFAFRLYTVRTVDAAPPRTSPDDYRRTYVSTLRSRLTLDDAQATQLDSILDATRARYVEVKKKYRPEMEKIHEEQVRDIRAMLRGPQLAEYEKYREEKKAKESSKK